MCEIHIEVSVQVMGGSRCGLSCEESYQPTGLTAITTVRFIDNHEGTTPPCVNMGSGHSSNVGGGPLTSTNTENIDRKHLLYTHFMKWLVALSPRSGTSACLGTTPLSSLFLSLVRAIPSVAVQSWGGLPCMSVVGWP